MKQHLLLLLLLLLLLVGCGDSTRSDVKGTVNWKGKPVPAGEVVFEPDPTKGNVGPQVIAPIENGHFTTASGKGSVTGPVTVTVRGFDGVPTGESPFGKRLFTPHTSQHDLSSGSSTLELTVPDQPK